MGRSHAEQGLPLPMPAQTFKGSSSGSVPAWSFSRTRSASVFDKYPPTTLRKHEPTPGRHSDQGREPKGRGPRRTARAESTTPIRWTLIFSPTARIRRLPPRARTPGEERDSGGPRLGMAASLQTETARFHSGYQTLITTAIDAHVMVGGNDLVRIVASVDRLTARITRRTFTWGYPDR